VLRGIRLNETRIEQLGWRVRGFQYFAFVVSGVYAGIAGGLLASLIFYVSPQTLTWNVSGEVLIVTLLGGVGTLLGPLVGVTVFELLKDELERLTPHWYGILGLIFVAATILMPRGVVGLVTTLTARLARRTP
jgi:branched-chain amino acid transport system permease protein